MSIFQEKVMHMLKNSGKVIMMTVLVLLLSSCTRTIYQEREVVRHDSIYMTAVSVDTVLVRDSIHTVEKGDTVATTIYKYIYKVRERTDTAYIERTDTVTMTETVEREKVVRKKDWLSIIGAIVIGAVAGIIIGKLRE